MMLASASAKKVRGDASVARDIRWRQWQGDRYMVGVAVWIQRLRLQGKGEGTMAPDQHRRGKGNGTMALPQR
jgi:hypothetical protein